MKPQPKKPRTYSVRLDDGALYSNLREREAKLILSRFEQEGKQGIIEPEPEERSAIDVVPQELIVFDAESDPPPACGMCWSPSHRQNYLGMLGKREYFRCQSCGFTHARRVDEMAF